MWRVPRWPRAQPAAGWAAATAATAAPRCGRRGTPPPQPPAGRDGGTVPAQLLVSPARHSTAAAQCPSCQPSCWSTAAAPAWRAGCHGRPQSSPGHPPCFNGGGGRGSVEYEPCSALTQPQNRPGPAPQGLPPSTGRSLVHKLEHKGAGGGVQLAHVLHELQVRHARHQLQLAIKKQVSKWEAATCCSLSSK